MSPEEQKADEEEAKKNEKNHGNKHLASEVEKGKLMMAPSKQEKETSQFESLKGKKGKKAKKQETKEEAFIDFTIIKRFGQLKIKAPLSLDDLERSMQDLDELKEALIYWGKIIQR